MVVNTDISGQNNEKPLGLDRLLAEIVRKPLKYHYFGGFLLFATFPWSPCPIRGSETKCWEMDGKCTKSGVLKVVFSEVLLKVVFSAVLPEMSDLPLFHGQKCQNVKTDTTTWTPQLGHHNGDPFDTTMGTLLTPQWDPTEPYWALQWWPGAEQWWPGAEQWWPGAEKSEKSEIHQNVRNSLKCQKFTKMSEIH